MNINFTKLLIAVFFCSILTGKAQQGVINDGHDHGQGIEWKLSSVQHVFDADSIRGFHEDAAWQQAKMTGAPEWEQKIQVSVAKRLYIDTKYGINEYGKAGGGNPSVQSPCTNVNFETGTTAGWLFSQGLNTNSLTQAGCCTQTTTRYSIVTPGADATIPGLQRVPPGGGNFSLKIGDGATITGHAVRTKQTFAVTAANSVFIYKFAVVLEDPISNAHDCNEQPYFNINFLDGSNNPIPCGNYNVVNASSGCSAGGDPSFVAFNTGGLTYKWKDWTTRAFDLTAYIGQNVTIEFIASDCTLKGHAGWAYVDAECSPMTLNLNGTEIPVGQTNNSFCGATTTNTLCAPSGFTYSWTGPGVNGETGQCINTSGTGTYSVSLGQTGASCFSPVLFSTFNSVPNPSVTASLTQPICALPAGSATISVAGGTGPYTYTWIPTAPSTSVNTNLSTGTSYTVSAEDDNGCIGITTFSIDTYPPAPAYILDVTPGYVLSCITPSTTITFTSTNTNTSANWSGPLGVITNSNIVVTAPGVYTYTAMNTTSTCSLTGTINITGALNIPVVTSTLTQPNCALPVGSASVSATNGTAPYTYSWSATVAAPSDTVNTNLPPGTGYTVSVTDDAGCTALTSFSINPFSGAPQYTLANNPSLALSCSSPSTTLTFGSTNANTNTSWSGPLGSAIGGTISVVTATAAGTYSYVAINTVSTCSITGIFVVTADTIKPSAIPTPSCNINTINLNASSTAGVDLEWIAPGTPTTIVSNPGSSTAIGVYTLVALNPNNGCIQTYTTLTSVPLVGIASTPTTNVLTCINTTIQANGTSSPTGANIVWNNGTSTVTTNPLPITVDGTYTVTATNALGCSSQSVITVNTNTVANVSINPSSTMISCATGSVTLNANSSVGGPYTYLWMPSTPTATGTSYIATSANTYSVIALNTANGCTTTATQAINMQSINASFNASVYDGLMPLPVTFTNTSIGTNPVGTNYTWSFGDGLSLASNDTTVNHLYNQDGLFPVILTATNGFCVDTAMRYIKVDVISLFEVPNVFTPNGDGKNDVFTFKAINMGEIHVIIYDRWGLNMFETTATGNVQWDGKNKGGATVTDGTYFYIIKASGLDGKTYDLKGTINVFQY